MGFVIKLYEKNSVCCKELRDSVAFLSFVFKKKCDYFMRISINLFNFALYSCFFNQGYLKTELLHFDTLYASLSWA